jgi:CubicO group peptidase (beta-lactamase class C family)
MRTPSLLQKACPVVVSILSLLIAALSARAGQFEWQTATPESQGMSSEKLEQFKDNLVSLGTSGLLVIRNDRIVCESYSNGQSISKPHGTASLAKALVGGMATAVAINDGLITLDDKVAKYVPQWNDDVRKAKITIRQLGSHTSGLADAEARGTPHEKLTGWQGDFWKRLPVPNDPFTISRDLTPLRYEPGERSGYSNPGIAMLSYAVTAAIKDSPQKDIRTLLRDRIMRPIGAGDQEWTVGYEQTFVVDGLPLVAPWGGGSYTARAAARVGRLMLREGDWDGKRVLSKDAARQVTRDVGTPRNGAIGWWSNNDRTYDMLPSDAFYGAGAKDQILLVIPSLKLIVVRNGDALGRGGVRKALYEPLMQTIVSDPPNLYDPRHAIR